MSKITDINNIVITSSKITDTQQFGEVVVTADKLNSFEGLSFPDEYYLESLTLITSVQNISLIGIMSEVSYFEDILKGVTTGVALVTDSLGLIDRLSMCGNEYLFFKFKKTKKTDDNYSIEKYFRVYRVGERMLNNNNGAQTYSLHFCSEELFLSEQTKISKAYDGYQISQIVEDILSTQMKIPSDKLIIQTTKNIYDFIIPNKKPFEAINWLSNYAQSQSTNGADFVFFENRDGFNFLSLQKMYSLKPYGKYQYISRNAGNFNGTTELGRSMTGIKSYSFLDTYDTLYGVNMGAFSNKLLSVDPLARKYRQTEFNYDTNFTKNKHLNSNHLINISKNRFGKTLSESTDSVLKVMVTNKDHKKLSYVNENTQRIGSVANDIDAETFVPNRTAQLALSQYSRIKLTVSGDPNLTIGQTIEVTLPSMKGVEALDTTSVDSYHTGKYLITAVRHIIDTNMRYETVLEIAKESLSSKLVDINDSDELVRSAKNNGGK